jgi:hypothetical protein
MLRGGGHLPRMLRTCSWAGCATLTLGDRCVEHDEPREQRVWLRGRPFVRPPEGADAALEEAEVDRPGTPASEAAVPATVGGV